MKIEKEQGRPSLFTKRRVFLLILTFAIAIVLLFIYYLANFSFWRLKTRPPKPTSTLESSFLLNEIGYVCSKKIEGEWIPASIGPSGQPGYYFQPTNLEDLEKYCREDYIIEYHAAIEILKRPEVDQAIGKFDHTEAWVKVLNAQYIQDKDYLNRIVPNYSHLKIHCIIVFHSPEENRFFIEVHEDEDHNAGFEYIEIPAEEFFQSLNNAPNHDIHTFWLNIR